MFTVDGDSLVEKQTGDGFDCTHVRKGEGDSLTMVRILDGTTLEFKCKFGGFCRYVFSRTYGVCHAHISLLSYFARLLSEKFLIQTQNFHAIEFFHLSNNTCTIP